MDSLNKEDHFEEITTDKSEQEVTKKESDFEMNPEQFEQLLKDLQDEGKKFAKELQKYKNAFFSQLDREVSYIHV
jgi:hypothetical protein